MSCSQGSCNISKRPHIPEDRTLCIDCKSKDVLKSVIDTVFMMHCDDCFLYKKGEKLRDWITVTENVLFPCDICLDIFRYGKPSVVHLCGRIGKHPCMDCGQLLDSERTLSNHLKIVHRSKYTDKLHQCKVCGKKFSRNYDLKRHIDIHTGDKPFLCNICCKPFSRKSNRNTHMRIHTGEKPHICTLCKKTFSERSTLSRHSLTHTGFKSCSCSICDKRFVRNDDLKKHMLVHTGDKPYICNVCGLRFSQSSNLRTHIRKHHVNACDST